MLRMVCRDASGCNKFRLLVVFLDLREEVFKGRELGKSSLMHVEDFTEESVVVDEIRHLLKQVVPIILSVCLYCFIFLEDLSKEFLIFHNLLVDLQLSNLLFDVPAKVALDLCLNVFVQHALLELFLPEKLEQQGRDYGEEFGVK